MLIHAALMLHQAKTPGGLQVDENHDAQLRKYHRANRRLIATLLIVWGFVSLGCAILFVVPLNKITLFGVPFGFWMAQQGSIFCFVILIFIYALRMDRLDHNYHADE